MLWLVSYDIAEDRRRRRVAARLAEVGRRVQWSVFECDLGTATLVVLLVELRTEMEAAEDSLRCYPLCTSCLRRCVSLGPDDSPRRTPYFLS